MRGVASVRPGEAVPREETHTVPNVRIRAPQDFGAAMLFISIGLLGLYFGADLAGMRAGAQLGSGSVPRGLSWLSIGFGAVMLVQSLTKDGPPIAPVPWRAVLVILSSVLLFGLLIERLGYVPAAFAAPFLASFALKNDRWRESGLFAAGLALATAVLFITLLGQPMLYFGSY
jgi:hypothetical protein